MAKLINRLKKKEKWYKVDLPKFDEYFECRELSIKEQKEIVKITNDVYEPASDVNKDIIKVNIGKLQNASYDASAYIVMTAFRFAESEKEEKQPIPRELVDELTNDELEEFLNEFNRVTNKKTTKTKNDKK